MSHNIIECEQGKFLLVNYDAFDSLGVALEQQCIEVAIPLYDGVEHALLDICQHTHLQCPALKKIDSLDFSESEIDNWESKRRAQLDENTHIPGFLFRGEKIQRQGLMPSAFRYLQNYSSLEKAIDIVRQRLDIELSAAKDLKRICQSQFQITLDVQQAKAAARHYGAPSHYLDFTLDPAVAGYFGHPGKLSSEEYCEPGVIYGISPKVMQTAFPMYFWKPDENHQGIEFSWMFQGASLPYLAHNKEKNKIVEKTVRITGVADFLKKKQPFIRHIHLSKIRRVAAQQGVFVGIDDSEPTQESILSQFAVWYLIDFVSFKWSYWHHQSQFECVERGITSKRLYVSDGSCFDSIETKIKVQLDELRGST
jgi:hypothetical protein